MPTNPPDNFNAFAITLGLCHAVHTVIRVMSPLRRPFRIPRKPKWARRPLPVAIIGVSGDSDIQPALLPRAGWCRCRPASNKVYGPFVCPQSRAGTDRIVRVCTE